MTKHMIVGIVLSLFVLTIAVGGSINAVWAQEARSIVPYPRGVLIETVDAETKMPRSSFCIGVNTIDVRLTNNNEYRQYVYVVNRDTRGTERTLYSGWLDAGQHYLSALIHAQLEVTGPAGTEALRVDIGDYGRITPGTWMTFHVQDCGGYPPPGGGYGHAFIWARIYPYAIPQGGKATITLQTTVGAQANMTYYFEILNSYDQLWKRIPVTKRPYEQYQITLPVGETTIPQMLIYTVNLWLESGYGEPQKVATTKFSFRVVTPGSTTSPYDQSYPGSPGYPSTPGYSWPPTTGDPYSGGMPYSPTSPYMTPLYGTYQYGTQYNVGGQNERSVE